MRVGLATAALVLWGVGPGGAAVPAPGQVAADTVPDLRDLFEPGRMLADRNGDGVLDFVDVEILLPERPTEAEITAAANVAARLGYETSAARLDLAATAGAARSGAPVVVVGRAALEQAGLAPVGAVLDRGLAPGEGTLVHLPPGPRAPRGGVVVLGYDATGLLAAAAYLAGRYPSVWALDGPRWNEAPDAVRAAAEGLGLELAPTLDGITVSATARGVPRARVSVDVPDPDARLRLLAFLEGREPADSAEVPADSAEAPPSLADLALTGLLRLDVRVTGSGDDRTVRVRPATAATPGPDPAYRRPGANRLSLATLYSIEGFYRDTNQDLVPDRTDAWLSIDGAEAPEGVVALATRLGLETAGARFPLARVAGQRDDPAAEGLPLLIGSAHDQAARLGREGRLAQPEPAAGLGRIEVVDAAFDGGAGLVVGGGDAAGTRAALDWLARRAPYLWDHGKGEAHLSELETDVRRFVQAREAPGQLALALAKLDGWLAEADTAPARIEVELAAREAPAGLADVVRGVVARHAPMAELDVRTWTTGYGVGDTVFVQDWDLPWEVDDVRAALGPAYEAVSGGEPVRIDVRVSEPIEVRRRLADEIRDAFAARGSGPVEVRVLSAYKQGYSWLVDDVLPRLRDTDVASIDLTYHTLEESEEVRWQTIAADTRWLQEVYPFDAVFARELSIPDSVVRFHPTREPRPVYTVVARGPDGAELLRESFDPRYVVRPFFDLFPEYEQVRVTTGWLTAVVGADTVVDQRIVTDPERFWDRFQTETYGRLIDYVMDVHDGSPSSSYAPYFDELRVDLRLSEPDSRIGVDEEVVSSLEALHEDIYFETLTLFDLIGARYQTSLPYPGRVLPWIDPGGAGRPGQARISLTGKERGVPELVVRTWTATAATPTVRRYALDPLPVAAPRVTGVTVDGEGIRRLTLRVELQDSIDRWPEFRGRSSEAQVDRQFTNAELAARMLDALGVLHDAGLLRDRLSWDRVGELALDLRVEGDSLWHRSAVLARSGAPASTRAAELPPPRRPGAGEPLVQWRTPIPPAENDSVLARLDTFEGVDVYPVAESFLGQTVWAVDLLPPHEAPYVSQAKLNALKPTLFISGRQHANEVSSTSHILRLAELLATDSAHRAMLDDVNVVLHPVTNPDGARLAVAMQEVTPDFMLHAGYLGALGVDVTAGEGDDDPVYPESQARRRLRETWLPDVYINMHGYPSHEWVQYFAGYSAWVRSRRGGARDWWAPRGWFIPGLSWVDDDEHPDYRRAQFAVLDSVAASIRALDDVEAMNRRLYGRYRKYGVQDRDEFTEYFHEGILVNLALRGRESIGTGVYSPRITWFATTTEAPDETARGDWLELVASAGLAHSTALLRYLAGGRYEIERDAEAYDDVVVRAVYRLRPVLPPEAEDEGGVEGEGR